MNVGAAIFIVSNLTNSKKINLILEFCGIIVVIFTCIVLLDAFRRFAVASPAE